MKFAYIDALRGVAILSVIWFHCHLYHYSDPAFYSLMDTLGSPAAMGVQLFFVLSAFTLFLSQSQRKDTEHARFNFFIRRFFRIAPMYYVAMAYYLWQDAYSYQQSLSTTIAYNKYGIIANSLLLHGLSPVWINSIIPGGWSVGIEVLFYAMVPYLFTRITTLNRAVLFTTAALLGGFVFTSALSQVPAIQANRQLNEYLFYYLPYQLPVFGCGIVAYYLVIRGERHIRLGVAIFAIGVLAFLILSKTVGKLFIPDLPHTLHLFGSLGFILLIIGASRHMYPVRFFLINRLTRYVGKVSYSAYLTHFGVLFWMDRVIPQQLIPVHSVLTNMLNFHLKFLLIVLITVLISTVTYRLIEEPVQQFGKRFLRRRVDREVLVAA
ncbi:acyltransferase family protein [Spirosoma agri]|uniref:Acyltransferase n=1 Tax=Spirosoma agri TaxID=1987381 RepID=A0A6M0IQL3_9BACT|nr:acyltransferase [Spirosoma agri]NEU69815.1 acyltransferase [Spirosoma agri]